MLLPREQNGSTFCPGSLGQNKRQNPVHVPWQHKLWQCRILCSSWTCRGSAGHGLRLGTPKDVDDTSHCYSKAALGTETQFGTLLPLFLQPAQKLSRLLHQNYLKTEFRSNLVPSNRCSISCFSPLKASLHPSTVTSVRHMGMETKHWEQSQPWNPDIHRQISYTSTKLLFQCSRALLAPTATGALGVPMLGAGRS